MGWMRSIRAMNIQSKADQSTQKAYTLSNIAISLSWQFFYAPYIETDDTHPVSNQWQYINKITLKGSTTEII
jgi:hypothetical protein